MATAAMTGIASKTSIGTSNRVVKYIRRSAGLRPATRDGPLAVDAGSLSRPMGSRWRALVSRPCDRCRPRLPDGLPDGRPTAPAGGRPVERRSSFLRRSADQTRPGSRSRYAATVAAATSHDSRALGWVGAVPSRRAQGAPASTAAVANARARASMSSTRSSIAWRYSALISPSGSGMRPAIRRGRRWQPRGG